MSHNLNSLTGGYLGVIYGTTRGDIKGDTRSLDYGSYHDVRVRRIAYMLGSINRKPPI